jgi:hypothetical protein
MIRSKLMPIPLRLRKEVGAEKVLNYEKVLIGTC